MNEHGDLYRQYKMLREAESQADEKETSVADNKKETSEQQIPSEIDRLYKIYRRNRDPDFEKSIALIMQAATEKIQSDDAIKHILDSATDQSVVLSKNDQSSQSLFIRMLGATSRALESLLDSFSSSRTSRWASVAVPIVALVAITIGLVGFLSDSPPDNQYVEKYNLAVFEANSSAIDRVQIARLVSESIAASSASTLGFAGAMNFETRAFLLGVASVDLQMATMTREKNSLEISAVRMANLLSKEQDNLVIDNLNSLSLELESADAKAALLVSDVGESLGSSEHWFGWGRDVQSVYITSLLALEQETVAPLRLAIELLKARFQAIDKSLLSTPEILAAEKISSFYKHEEFTLEQLRSIQNGARDIKELRVRSAR